MRARMRANIDGHLRAVAAADPNAAPVDVDGEARRAGALALSQLAALEPDSKGTPDER